MNPDAYRDWNTRPRPATEGWRAPLPLVHRGLRGAVSAVLLRFRRGG